MPIFVSQFSSQERGKIGHCRLDAHLCFTMLLTKRDRLWNDGDQVKLFLVLLDTFWQRSHLQQKQSREAQHLHYTIWTPLHCFAVDDSFTTTWCRVSIFPDFLISRKMGNLKSQNSREIHRNSRDPGSLFPGKREQSPKFPGNGIPGIPRRKP